MRKEVRDYFRMMLSLLVVSVVLFLLSFLPVSVWLDMKSYTIDDGCVGGLYRDVMVRDAKKTLQGWWYFEINEVLPDGKGIEKNVRVDDSEVEKGEIKIYGQYTTYPLYPGEYQKTAKFTFGVFPFVQRSARIESNIYKVTDC